jgi:hypothetical protein
VSLESKRVNIVEQRRWKPYDPAGETMELASNNAYDEFKHMSKNDLIRLVEDMLGRAKQGPLEWSPRTFVLSDEEYDLILEEIKDYSSDLLETARESIVDALQWMWEVAYMPDDGDIELAVEETDETMADTHGIDESLWEPLLERKGWDERTVIESLAEEVTYERQEGYYDRYIVFNFGEAKAVEKLLKTVYADPEELSEKETVSQLKVEFEALEDSYLDLFFDKLDKIMQNIDAANRTDFKKQWKAMLGDKNQMNAVGKEIREFILEARAKGVE